MSSTLRLYVDGAIRGTPAQGAASYRLLDASDEVLLERAQQIGGATSSEAEFRAVILGLSACEQYRGALIHCFTDSELMVRQLRGEHRVNDPRLRQLVERVQRLTKQFRAVTFTHVRRTDPEMARADRLASEALR